MILQALRDVLEVMFPLSAALFAISVVIRIEHIVGHRRVRYFYDNPKEE